jgi:transmembrane sensor
LGVFQHQVVLVISMMDDEEIKMLLVKYITRQANDEEMAFIKQWVTAHPENEQYFAQLYEAWQNSLLLEHNIIDADNAYQRFANKITIDKQPAKKAYRTWHLVSALVVTVIAAVFLIKSKPVFVAPLNQVTAKPGNVRKVMLTDGTIVWLNAGSTLKYDDHFGKTNRSVYLDGEGFFEIAHGKKDIPFIVNTKNYLIRDIGTRFNLKAYPNDLFFETSVVNGEVSIEEKDHIENAMNRIYIKQKQALRIWNRPSESLTATGGFNSAKDKRYNEIQITQFTPDKEINYTGWKDDLLVFDSNTLQDISRVLERHYNVQINISDTILPNVKYTGNFKNAESIEKVLDIIKQNTPIKYSKLRNTITITEDK